LGLRPRRIHNFVVYAEFSVVGVANAVVDFGTLNLLLWLWPSADPGRLALYNTLALVLANANSYLRNTLWTFRRQARRAHPRQKRVGFGAQALLNIVVNNALFWVGAGLLADTSLPVVVGQNIAKLISTVGASSLSFLVLRYIVFRPRSSK
jgi:putative flippase GtrA